ncbi:sensor histidine kinase [Marinicrinis lubricantis]|uniref:histidine kinase n=1 Tax=Marinicrinis lubricantis TaxID=2086470 RepID=A0ABW1IQE1_9BACL
MNFRRFYKNLLIKNKIFFFTIIIMLVVSSISITAVHFATQLYEKIIYDEASQVLTLSSTSIDNELKRIEKLTFTIMSDATIQQNLSIIRHEDTTEFDVYKVKDVLMERLLFLSQQDRFISSIQIIDSRGNQHSVSLTNKNINMASFAEDPAVAAAGANIWMPSTEKNVLITARTIRETRNLNLNQLGLLIVYIDMNRLVDQTLDLSENKMFMIEHDGQMLLTSNPKLSSALIHKNFPDRLGYQIATLQGDTYFITHLTSRYQSFTYYNVISYEHTFNQSRLIGYGLIALYGLLFLLALSFGRWAANTISRPLELLIQKMKQVQLGHIDPKELFQVESINMDETGQINRHFRLMLQTINELIRENYSKQLAIKESEYKAIQAQINPHFLYNTLESINWMAKVNKQKDISMMVEALGNLLRGIISNKAPLITIDEEIHLIEHYITIQQMRFGERLAYSSSDLSEFLSFQTPKLTIQPIIENAIHHGLEMISGVCKIRLDIQAKDHFLLITVTDNGPGIDDATLGAIHQGVVKSKGTGIGLKSIHERIRLLFGDAYGLHIESVLGHGTTVRIQIPYCEGEESKHVQGLIG